MLKKMLVMLMVVSLGSVAVGSLVVDTSTGGTSAGVIKAITVQHFTVPAGYELNSLRWHSLYAGNNRTQPVNAQIFTSAGSFKAVGSAIPWGNWFLIDVVNLTLPAGTYYVQAFSNNANAQLQFGANVWSNTSYTGGYAATGWSGGTPTAEGQDFGVVLTMSLIPEPATLCLLGLASVFMVRRRG